VGYTKFKARLDLLHRNTGLKPDSKRKGKERKSYRIWPFAFTKTPLHSSQCRNRGRHMSPRISPGEIQAAPTLATWHKYNVLQVSRVQASLHTLIRGLYPDPSYLLYLDYRHSSAEQAHLPIMCSFLQWSLLLQ